MEILIKLVIVFIFVCISGYFMSLLKENIDFKKNQILIDSKKVTQDLLDGLDYKKFKLGNTRLNIGDEVKVYLSDDKLVRGTVLGAKRRKNSVCILADFDEVIELSIKSIKKLKVTEKYGRIF